MELEFVFFFHSSILVVFHFLVSRYLLTIIIVIMELFFLRYDAMKIR